MAPVILAWQAAKDTAGDETLQQLEDCMLRIKPPTKEVLVEMIKDTHEPDAYSIGQLIFLRLRGAETTPVLYLTLCRLLNDLDIDLMIVPGGLKKMPRIVFKSMIKYGGKLSGVRDVSRITVIVHTLKVCYRSVMCVAYCSPHLNTKGVFYATYQHVLLTQYCLLLSLVHPRTSSW